MELDLTKPSKKAGASPGTLAHVGRRRMDDIRINIITYGEQHLVEKRCIAIGACKAFLEGPGVAWFSVTGIHDAGHIEDIGDLFHLHPLVLEDVMQSEQRPKMEEFDGYIFVVLKMLFFDKEKAGVRVEQVSLILGPGYVLSFQESEDDVFEPLRQRIRMGKGRIRNMGSDYLAYAIMDSIVDHYFVILEEMGEAVEALEEAIVSDPKTKTMHAIQKLKRQLISFRRAVWPLREAISSLQQVAEPLISRDLSAFLRDLHDHTIQVLDTEETFHNTISEALDLYMSSLSKRMSQVAQVLTMVATIFIPLTFIAGVYGMNFKYMPELAHPWGYPACLLLMLAVAVGMLLYFRRKHWF